MRRFCCVGLVLLFTSVMMAQSLPKTRLHQLVQTVQQHVAHHGIQQSAALVKKVQSYIDGQRIAQSIAGRAAWRQASSGNRQRFVSFLERYVTHHYLRHLADMKNSQVTLRAQAPKRGDKYAQVVMFITHPNGGVDDCVVYFRRHVQQWKVTDLHYNRLSILKQLKAKFQPIIRQYGLNHFPYKTIEDTA